MSNYSNYLNESLQRLQTIMDDSGSRPILFIGTGISRRYVNAPNWEGILEALINDNHNIKYPLGYYTQKTNNDLPRVASELVDEYYNYAWENHNNGTFPRELYDTTYKKDIFLKYEISKICTEVLDNFDINGNPFKEELDLLKKLQPHSIITTNYDCLLETIFKEYTPIIGQQVIKKRESTNIGHILKIHGCVSKPDEIVISSEDYDTFNQRQKYLIAKLLTYFIEHPVIFIGYSLSDSNIKGILKDICEVVVPNSEDVMENIWFIECKKEQIDSNYCPPTDKIIDLGDSKTIRVNYIQMNSFIELYSTLYQGSAANVNILNNFQNNIYNIVKSKTITNKEVDLITLQRLSDEKELIKLLELDKVTDSEGPSNTSSDQMISMGYITDPECILTRYPLRISDISNKLGYTHWYFIDKLIKKIELETGVNIRETNNRYHINVGVKVPQHRYSVDAIKLLEKISKEESYYVYDEHENKIMPQDAQGAECGQA